MRRFAALLFAISVSAGLAPAAGAALDCEPSPGSSAITRFVPFTNRFGEQIAVDLYKPGGVDPACRFPVVLESSPYRDWTTPQPTKVTDDERRLWWVDRGYIYAFADVPGSGGSDGEWCLFCLHEQLSGVDIVNELGEMPGSNGRVGMIGGSYPGITALLVAQHSPKHLRAVISAAFLLDLYDDFFYVGGMRRGEDAVTLMTAFTALSRWTGRYDAPADEAELARFLEVWQARAAGPPAKFLTIQDDHPTRDGFYEERSVRPEQVRVPVYLFGGWNDMFARATWEAWDRVGSKVKVLRQGPFTHVPFFMPPGAWPCESQNFDFCGAPLFDRHLKGAHNSDYEALLENPVKSYLQPAAGYLDSPAKPETREWSMVLGSGEATLRWDPAAGATSGRWFARGSVPGAFPPFDYYLGVDGPLDQRGEEATGLSFASPPLDETVTIVGGGRLSLSLTSDAPLADIIVHLVDEFPAGDARFPAGYGYLVTSGWRRATLTPDQPASVEVEIWPTGYRFPPGHRIRIDVQPSDVPRFAPSTSPANLTIDLEASLVTLAKLSE